MSSSRHSRPVIEYGPSDPASDYNASRTNSAASSQNHPTRYADYHAEFVPATNYPDAALITSTSTVRRAVLLPCGTQAFVYTGQTHGGISTGGPAETQGGYYVNIQGKVLIHQSGRATYGVTSQDLGPAYGTGPEHGDTCRKLTRLLEFQNCCFCTPIPLPRRA